MIRSFLLFWIFISVRSTIPLNDIDSSTMSNSLNISVFNISTINQTFENSKTYSANFKGNNSEKKILDDSFRRSGLMDGSRMLSFSNSQGNGISIVIILSDIFTVTSQVNNLGTSIISLINFNNPAAICLNSILAGLIYIKYMDINYSPQLAYILDQTDQTVRNSLENLFHVPDSIQQNITRGSLPAVFQQRNIHSSFLINFWLPLLTIGVIIGIIIITSMVECCTGPKQVFSKIKQILEWNYFLIIFTGYYGDLSLFTSLEMRTLDFSTFLDKAFEISSFILCIFLNLIALLIISRKVIFIIDLRKESSHSKKTQKPKHSKTVKAKSYEGYEVLFERFKTGSFMQQGFLIFFSIRQYLVYTVVGYLFEYPLIQTILINVLGVAMLLYLVAIKPPKFKIELAQYLFQETIFQVFNVCMFILAMLDRSKSDHKSTHEVICYLIIGCYSALQIFSLIYLGYQMVIISRDAIKAVRTKLDEKKVVQLGSNRMESTVNHTISITTHPLQNQNSITLEQSESNLSQWEQTLNHEIEIKEREGQENLSPQALEKMLREKKRRKKLERFRNRLFHHPDLSPGKSNSFSQEGSEANEQSTNFESNNETKNHSSVIQNVVELEESKKNSPKNDITTRSRVKSCHVPPKHKHPISGKRLSK